MLNEEDFSYEILPFVMEFWKENIVFDNINNNDDNKIGIIMKKCV